MYFVYVLYSKKYDKIYIGQTDNMRKRLFEHNNGLLGRYTKSFRPWVILYSEKFTTRAEAMKREKQLKSSRGRSWIWAELLGKEKF